MPFVQFHDYLPELAERETRSVTIFSGSGFDLPSAEYGLVEMFCDEPGCDCRRVILMVMSSRTEKPEAFVSFGWESRHFYVKWMGDDDPLIITDLMGPALNFGSPAARHAPAILEMVKETALNYPEYVTRVKRHYALFREKIDDKMIRQQRRRSGRKR
jgi:hypothetical protein